MLSQPFDLKYVNPLNVPLYHELAHEPQPVKNWTEYWYFLGYDVDQQRGVSIHIGRDCADPTIFHGSMAIFLPDGEMLTGMYRGRNGDHRGPGAGPLKVTCVEPGQLWMAQFDGLAHRMHRSALMNDVFKDSVPELASFNIRISAASPLFDFERSQIGGDMLLIPDHEAFVGQSHQALGNENKKTNHWEQVCTSRGEIAVGGETFALEGAGMRDHSFGPRDYSAIIGNHWFNGVFPSGRSFMLMTFRVRDNFICGGFVYRADGTPAEFIRGGVTEHPVVGAVDTPDGFFISDVMEDPHIKTFRLVFETKAGREVIEGETLHGIATTYISPAHEILGTDFSRTVGASQMCECPARYRWKGEVGGGMMERIVPIKKLRRPAG